MEPTPHPHPQNKPPRPWLTARAMQSLCGGGTFAVAGSLLRGSVGHGALVAGGVAGALGVCEALGILR